MNPILQEWLSPQSLGYLAECLQECQDAAMVAELRSFVPSQALKEAVRRLSLAKRRQIKAWVERLNNVQQGVAK